mgnify:CR=1 FL=1
MTVWCETCTTLQACGDKQLVEKKSIEKRCIEGDCQNGWGAEVLADGETYQGEYKNGKKDRQGTYTSADGAKYQGQWKNGKMDGQVPYTYADGKTMTQSEYKNGVRIEPLLLVVAIRKSMEK